MTVLIYSAKSDSIEKRLLKKIGNIQVVVCRNVDQLKRYLNVPTRMRKIIVLVIQDRDEMADISKLLELYFDLLLIVILDGDHFETATDAHKLRPRFVTYKDSDFEDVRIVLGKMMAQMRQINAYQGNHEAAGSPFRAQTGIVEVELILYLPAASGCVEQLVKLIRTVISHHEIRIYRSITDLAERLRKPPGTASMAVLYTATCADLMEVVRLGDALGELRVVLVLPDGEPELLEKAHLLWPHSIVSTESDLQYLGGILKRMLDLNHLNYKAINRH